MPVPPPPSSSAVSPISSPQRYLRSRTRTSFINFFQQSTVASPPTLAPGARNARHVIEKASPLPPAETSPTSPLSPSYELSNEPYTPSYALGSGVSVSPPATSPSIPATTIYPPTLPLAPLPSWSPWRVRPVPFGLLSHADVQGSSYSPLAQPDYALREENSSEVPLERGPSGPPPLPPRTYYPTSSTINGGSQIGSPRDADESASGRPSSPRLPAIVSPLRGLTSFHSPAPSSAIPRSEAAGGVVRFAVGFTPRPQSQVENPRAPVFNSVWPVTSTTPAVRLGEARTQKDADIPSKPNISGSNSTRITRADNNTMTLEMLKETPLVSNGLGLKTQSPGTDLFQTSHTLADTFFPGIQSPFQDEPNDGAETKETATPNDSPSSISLTVLSSSVISSSVTLDKVAPTLRKEALPEISRSDNAEPDTIAAVEGPDDASEDIANEHVLTSLISIGLPAPSGSPVAPVSNVAFDVKEDSDHPVIVPSDKTDYAAWVLASDDITTGDVPSLPFPSSSPPPSFSTIEETPVDAEITVGPSPIVEEALPVQPAAEPLTIVTETHSGSSSISFVLATFEEVPHDVKASTVSESRAPTPVETILSSEPIDQGSIDVSGPSEPEIDLHQKGSSELSPPTPHDAEPLTFASQATSTAVGGARDMDADYPASEEHAPGPSLGRVSDVFEIPVATTFVEEASIVTSGSPAPEADLQPATSEGLVLDSPTPWGASVANVAETPVSSAPVEQPRAVTSGPPDPEDDQATLASKRPVLDGPTNWEVRVADGAKVPPPGASVGQPRAVTLGPPGSEDNLAPPVSKRSVFETPLDWGAPVIDVVKAPPSSASDKQPKIIASGPPEPEDALTTVASEIPALDFLIDWEAPVIDVPEAPVPSALVKQSRVVTTEGPEPEDHPASGAPEGPMLDFLIDWGSFLDEAEVPVPSAFVEQPRAVTTKGPESQYDPNPVASERSILDFLIDWEGFVIDVPEAPISNASIGQAWAVKHEGPEPALAPERPVLDSPTPWDSPIADVASTPPPSASHKHPKAVTSRLPEPEDYMTPAASEGPVFGPLIDWEAPVIDATKARPSSSFDEQPRAVTSGPPEPEDARSPAASERPVLDIAAHGNTDVTDVAEAPQLSASSVPVEISGVVLSGPPDPADDLDDTTSDRLVSKTSYPSDPQVTVTDMIGPLASSVYSGDDTLTTVYPPSAGDDSTQAGTKEQALPQMKTHPTPGIDRFNVFAAKALESLTSYDPHRSSTSEPLSGQTDERPPIQPANPFPTSTPSTGTSPKGVSTGIEEATSILQDIVITALSTEVFGQGPGISPSRPPEIPELTGRIVRLGLTPIATGGYSSVWRGSLLSGTSDDPDQALQVAIKVLRASYTDEFTLQQKLHKRLHVEMRVWAQLRHENVVRLLGHTEESEGPGLVSILYLHGNVLSFLAKNPSVNREIICADVALGLQYLHEHDPPIIHGDLKGPNVLIDAEGRASICDFGLSIILDGGPTGHTSSNFGGSLRFLAPELLEESTRTVQTDIYTYACTCIEILFDQQPYQELSKEAHLMRAISDRRPPIEPSNEEVTFPLLWRILKRCWDHDRSSRPPLNQIIETIQRCLYRSDRTNLAVRQGIGRRVRFMCLPGVEQGALISVAEDGLSVVVNSSDSSHRVPIYQRYRWEFMDALNLEDSEDESDVSWPYGAAHQYSSLFSLLGKFAPSSESPAYASKWKDYSTKFRLPYSSRVSFEPYNEVTS